MTQPNSDPTPLYTDQQLIHATLQVEHTTAQDILDDVLEAVILHVSFDAWPDLIVHSLLRLVRQHDHPAAFLTTLTAQLAAASACLHLPVPPPPA